MIQSEGWEVELTETERKVYRLLLKYLTTHPEILQDIDLPPSSSTPVPTTRASLCPHPLKLTSFSARESSRGGIGGSTLKARRIGLLVVGICRIQACELELNDVVV